MYFAYNLALCLGSILLFPWLVFRSWRGRLPGFRQRFGFFSLRQETGSFVAWFHAVSVGEVKAALILREALKEALPDARVVITSSTAAGWNAARANLTGRDAALFPPIDFRFVCRRFLKKIHPNFVVVLETELWPNLFREVKRSGAVLLVANGRISDRTFPRYRATRWFWKAVFRWPDMIFAQSQSDVNRFEAIGAPATKVRLAGNLKFSALPEASPFTSTLRELLNSAADHPEPILVAGSTMPGEDNYLIGAFQALASEFPKLWMILAPRHPDRSGEIVKQVEAAGVPVQLRSRWTQSTKPNRGGILVLDSIGELGSLYQLATVAFVGGTLVPTGGHNIIEPAIYGRPIIIGPSMSNFREIVEDFLRDAGLNLPGEVGNARVGAIIQIEDHKALIPVLRFLFRDAEFCRRLGEAACERWKRNLDSVARIAEEIKRAAVPDAANNGRGAVRKELAAAAKLP